MTLEFENICTEYAKNKGFSGTCMVKSENKILFSSVYGYAFEFLEIDNSPFCMFKEGQNDGVAAIFSYCPKVDITVSVLANQNCNVWEMHREMQTEIYNRFYL